MTETSQTQTPASTTPAADTTPAANAPARAPTFADIVAARRNAANAQPPVTAAPAAEAPKADPQPGTAPAAKAVEVNIDEKALDQFVGLTKELTKTRAKTKELEARAELADKHEQVTKLIAEGKVIEALDLLGKDVLDKATQQALGTKTPDDPLAPIKSELEKLKADQAEKDKKAADEKAAAQAAHDEASRQKVIAEVSKLTDRFPFLTAKPDKIREALTEAEKAHAILLKENGGKELTAAENDKLLRAAIEEGEHRLKTDYEELAKAATRTPAPAAPAGGTTTFDASMRGGTTPTTPSRKMTFDEVRKARRLAA
jgi:hypothetical protein